jgi:hypothetical protein
MQRAARGKQTNKQANKQTSKQTNKQTNGLQHSPLRWA